MPGGFGDFLGSLFSSVAGAQDGTHVRIWNELKPWVASLLPNATTKWLPRIASGIECEVPLVSRGNFTNRPCDHLAIGACDVCHRPVCLSHGRIDQAGDIICYICVADAMTAVPPLQRERARKRGPQQKPPPRPTEEAPPPGPNKPPPSPRELLEAFHVLGLEPGASWDAVRGAHRRLTAKYHPDRQRKTQASSKYLKVQEAFELLKRVYPEAS